MILAGNRDEFFSRSTAPLSFWEENKEILAGRDLERGGTWLGVTRSGKIGALTNYREVRGNTPSPVSRGEILSRFFSQDVSCQEFLAELSILKDKYQGFNLLIGDNEGLYYFSNRDGAHIKLQPGIYGLSNHLLNTGWPKVERGKELFEKVLHNENNFENNLFTLLKDTNKPTDEKLPQTGVGLDWERLLSTIFISGATYGTRTSAVVTQANDGTIQICERTYNHDEKGQETADQLCFTVMGRDS